MLMAVMLLCGLAFQSTDCVYIYPRYFGRGLPLPSLPYNAPKLPIVKPSCTPLTLANLAGNRGGSFKVVCSSPVAPTGISIVSENTMEGSVYVTGEVPFVGAVVIDGSLPAAGAGAVSYECGGTSAVLNEGFNAAIAPVAPAITISAPTCAAVEISVPASIPAEIVAPLYDSYAAFPSSVVVISPSVAPKAAPISPVIGGFRFRRNFRGFGSGLC